MSTGLVKVIKDVAMDAVDNAKMSDLRFGTVISTSPLKVRITNQFILPESILIVPQHLTDYEVEVEVHSWNDSRGDSLNGTKKMTIKNALKVGDKVALMRKQGGQSYFILDRLAK